MLTFVSIPAWISAASLATLDPAWAEPANNLLLLALLYLGAKNRSTLSTVEGIVERAERAAKDAADALEKIKGYAESSDHKYGRRATDIKDVS